VAERDDVAEPVVGVFRKLFAARFPIEAMRLARPEDLTAPPTGRGNGTAAVACRAATGQTRFSAHASGLAIDVNPFQNPLERRAGLVVPELASAYTDRSWRRPGMIAEGDVVTEAFAAIGWTWGATFSAANVAQRRTSTTCTRFGLRHPSDRPRRCVAHRPGAEGPESFLS
jgi:hypothetical protein